MSERESSRVKRQTCDHEVVAHAQIDAIFRHDNTNLHDPDSSPVPHRHRIYDDRKDHDRFCACVRA